MERYENIIKIEEIRRLIDDNLYAKAAKILDTMDISRIKALTDLSILADVLTQNDRFEEAMEILQKIFSKSKTRRVLYQLVDVSIRMEDTQQAKEYLKMYIKVAPTDSQRYIFRYCIDKLDQKSYEVLLSSLEQLKEYEYIEMWAYELAKVYHKAGMKDKCVRECSDIILWFGDGIYVEKAKLLKAFYVGDLNPAHIMNAKNKKDILKQLEKTKDYSTMRDEINQYLAKEEEEKTTQKLYSVNEEKSYTTSHGVDNIEEDNSVYFKEPEDIKLVQNSHEIVEYIKKEKNEEILGSTNDEIKEKLYSEVNNVIDNQIDDEIKEKINKEIVEIKEEIKDETDEEINTHLYNEIQNGIGLSIDKDITEEFKKEFNQKNNIEPSQAEYEEINKELYKETINEEIDCNEKQIQAIPTEQWGNRNEVSTPFKEEYSAIEKEVALTDELTHSNMEVEQESDIYEYFRMAGFNVEEEFEPFLLVKGMKGQIQNALENILSDAKNLNYLAINGNKKTGRSTLAKKICKGLFSLNWIKSAKIAKISGDKLNKVNLLGQKDKLINGALIIEDANAMNEDGCNRLAYLIEEMRDNIFVILEDEAAALDGLFLRIPSLSTYFKNCIFISNYSDRELFQFANHYIKENNYQFLTEAKIEFFNKIGQILKEKEENALEAVMNLAKSTVKTADNRYKRQLADILSIRNLVTEDLLYIVKEDILED